MKNINFLLEKPIAHRGLRSVGCPENSVCAFLRALEQKIPIELDVQTTSDGKLVVFHDWNVKKLTGKDGNLGTMNLEELKKLYLQDSEEQIPTFKEVLNVVDGNVPIIVEIKSKSIKINRICEAVIKELKGYRGLFAINSFNPFVIRWIKNNFPNITRGQNFTNFEKANPIVAFCGRMALHFLWLISANNPDFFVIRAGLLPDSFPVWVALRRNKPILVYSLGDKKKCDRIKDVVNNELFDDEPLININNPGR